MSNLSQLQRNYDSQSPEEDYAYSDWEERKIREMQCLHGYDREKAIAELKRIAEEGAVDYE
jgi:hypothetical protein